MPIEISKNLVSWVCGKLDGGELGGGEFSGVKMSVCVVCTSPISMYICMGLWCLLITALAL